MFTYLDSALPTGEAACLSPSLDFLGLVSGWRHYQVGVGGRGQWDAARDQLVGRGDLHARVDGALLNVLWLVRNGAGAVVVVLLLLLLLVRQWRELSRRLRWWHGLQDLGRGMVRLLGAEVDAADRGQTDRGRARLHARRGHVVRVGIVH